MSNLMEDIMRTHREVAQVKRVRALGYTRKVSIEGPFGGFEGLIRPDTDLDDTFKAWDLDNGEWMKVHGWNCSIEEAE